MRDGEPAREREVVRFFSPAKLDYQAQMGSLPASEGKDQRMRDRRDIREIPRDASGEPPRIDRARIALAFIGLAGALAVLAMNTQL